ncbi:hypothetical protein [Bosea sp. LjRoot237]|uniref:hypothetical protein n=1 Tax=Bosea sp. LjRoot237 TaxID=3342292 RepID=UPI003ECDEBF7
MLAGLTDPYKGATSNAMAGATNRGQASVPQVPAGLASAANSTMFPSMPQADTRGIPTSVALTVGGGLCAIVLALVSIIYSSVSGDVTELKKDVKEIRADIAGLSKQAVETNVRLGATNDKLQTLIDETRRRTR